MMKKIRKGFSLIEVLIAISIVALIAIVSLPLFSLGNRNINSSKDTSEDLFEVERLIEEGNAGSMTIGSLYIDENFNIPINIFQIHEGDVSIIHFGLIMND